MVKGDPSDLSDFASNSNSSTSAGSTNNNNNIAGVPSSLINNLIISTNSNNNNTGSSVVLSGLSGTNSGLLIPSSGLSGIIGGDSSNSLITSGGVILPHHNSNNNSNNNNSGSNNHSIPSIVNSHLSSFISNIGNKIEMKLVESVVASFRVAKLFRENTERINSIDFSPNGETLITSSDDDSIVIYDCEKGTMRRTLNSKKYGVDLIHYTHAQNTAIHSSNKVDDTIRYLSLHDNKYIRYFPGHTKKVVTLCMSPVDDTFLSGSLDKTIRLWDLRSPNCQGLMHLLGRPVANFDPEGLIFAVGINSESVKLYDLRSFDKGPFNTFKLPQDTNCDWTGLKFSPDGKMIMIYTNGNIIHLIDGFTGNPLQTLSGHVNNKGLQLEASFSPDSQFIFSGSTDGKIHVWNAFTGNRVSIMNFGDHTQPVQCVQFNPKYMLLASACNNMAFWVPQPQAVVSDE